MNTGLLAWVTGRVAQQTAARAMGRATRQAAGQAAGHAVGQGAPAFAQPEPLRHVRATLTLLYLGGSLLLVLAMGATAYLLTGTFLARNVDSALQQRLTMAIDDREFGVSAARPSAPPAADSRGRDDHDEGDSRSGKDGERDSRGEDDGERHAYDADLAPIFVLPLRADGTLAANLLSRTPPLAPDRAAAAAALASGQDARTTRAPDGDRARIVTVRVPGVPSGVGSSGTSSTASGVVLLQAGRLLTDQDRLMSQLLGALVTIGGGSVLALSAVSWWWAGRTLAPAHQAWERQRAFVASAGHELRAPLTLLRASADVALQETAAGDESQRALLTDILGECDHLARLVDDLLLLSRLDAGRLTLQREPVDVGQLVADVRRQAGRLAQQRGVVLVAPSPSETDAPPLTLLADETRLRQILLILVDNALRYTPPGGRVEIVAGRQSGHVCLAVADNGPGIAAADSARVFERFYRAGGTNRHTDGGSGLGLAIAKALVEAHGGSIRLDSHPGQGTRVEVTLPG